MTINKRYYLTISLLVAVFLTSCCLCLLNFQFRIKTFADGMDGTITFSEETANCETLELYSQDGYIQRIAKPNSTYDVENEGIATHSAAFTEHKILDSGKPDSESLVITVMGDGFTSSQQTDFLNATRSMIENLIGNGGNLNGIYPYELFRSAFTVYAIEVISNESGVSRDSDLNNGQIVDNYFGSSFYHGSDTDNIQRGLVIQNYSRARELTKPNSMVTVILCNSTRHGGTGGEFAVVSMHDPSQILAHEIGHTFGKLADEYYYPEDGKFYANEAPNKTENNDRNTVKWKYWLDYDDVDIYPYSTGVDTSHKNFDERTNKWYKPHTNCLMEKTTSQFCPVCSAVLIQKMEERAGKLFDVTEVDDGSICINSINLSINGDFILKERFYEKTIVEIGNLAFANQNLLTKIVLPKTLVNIGDRAFENCTNLMSISPLENVTNIGVGAFSGCNLLRSIIFPNIVEIGDGAFVGCNNLEFYPYTTNLNYTTQNNNILLNKDETKIIATGKIPSNVKIPDTVTEIAPSAFEGNTNLRTLDFGKNSPIICERAFADCTNLNEVYFYSYDIPTYNADSFYNDSFTAYVPYISQGDYAMTFEQSDVDVTVLQTVLSYVSDGQVIHQEDVYYGSILHSLYLPSRDGYSFDGWYRNSSLQEPISDGVLWEEKNDTSLYAKWQEVEYKIFFNLHGGTLLGENPLPYTINDAITFAEPTKTGHTFTGWTINGQAVDGINEGTFGDIIVDANWQANSYVITLDNNGGSPESETINAIFGEEFSVTTIPTLEGNILEGWYDQKEGGTRYIAADGKSVYLWNKAQDITLYAHWKPKSYEIQINDNGSITWLGASGLSNEPCLIEYGTIINSINLIAVFKQSLAGYKDGHIFDHFEYLDKTLDWTSIPDLGDNGAVITIDPIWVLEEHSIYFQTLDEVITISPIVALFDEDITLPVPHKVGNRFLGWYTSKIGGNKVTWTKMPDLTPNKQNNGSCELYAHYELITYTVFLDPQGGTGGTEYVSPNYKSILEKVIAPSKVGNSFDGYYTKPDGQGTRYYDSQMNGTTWDIPSNTTLYANWIPNTYVVTLDRQGGTSGATNVTATYGSKLLPVAAPTRTGYDFKGYYSETQGKGTQYYDSDMNGVAPWIKAGGGTIYAHWVANTYTITFNYGDILPYTYKMKITYGEIIPDRNQHAPIKEGHEFVCYYGYVNGEEEVFYEMRLRNDRQGAAMQGTEDMWVEFAVPIWGEYNIADDITLYARFKPLECEYSYENYDIDDKKQRIGTTKIELTNKVPILLNPTVIKGYTFDHYEINTVVYSAPCSYSTSLYRNSGDGRVYVKDLIFCYYKKDSCISQGTLITLADGTQVPVESLKGDEMLLVWNMITGKLDAARIMFVDSDKAATYKVINLGFSDGTTVKVISEHGFWDYDLNKFVYLRSDASKYIGHWFNKGDTRVQLTSVEVCDEYTVAYSPVTYGHLCYYVNGMLSMPGGIDGLFNIFEVDPDTMTVNAEAMARDIETYGLFTYDEFIELVPVTEDVFNAFNGQYLKVAIGKGMITVEQLNNLVNRYAEFFVEVE